MKLSKPGEAVANATNTRPVLLLKRRFTPDDFAKVIAAVPDGCPLVGGQAVAWWAIKYAALAKGGEQRELIASADIDFWGSQDELHLKASLDASQHFVRQLLGQKAIRETLWNCERLIFAHQMKAYQKLARTHAFDVLTAIPIPAIRQASKDPDLEPE